MTAAANGVGVHGSRTSASISAFDGRWPIGGRSISRRRHPPPLAALTAVRHDGSLGRFYRRQRQRGKPGKVALVAAMRKLLLQLNAVARRGTPWTEAPALTA